jgi:hypothetical protein
VYEHKKGQKAKEKREELLFGGEKEHIFVVLLIGMLWK